MARTNLPKFGNWETEEDVPYTTYFENPRRVSSTDKVNSNSSTDNPNPSLVSKMEKQRVLDALKTRNVDKVSREDGEVQRSYGSPSRLERGRKHGVASSDAPKRGAKSNGGGFRSADHSPLHPLYQAKINAKGSTISSPSREKTTSSEGSQGLAPSTPGRSRLRSVPRGNETPDRGASVPKFGEWDETDPSSADGYTHIFNKVKEERHGSTPNTRGKATHSQYSDTRKHHASKNSKGGKGCWCLPW